MQDNAPQQACLPRILLWVKCLASPAKMAPPNPNAGIEWQCAACAWANWGGAPHVPKAPAAAHRRGDMVVTVTTHRHPPFSAGSRVHAEQSAVHTTGNAAVACIQCLWLEAAEVPHRAARHLSCTPHCIVAMGEVGCEQLVFT